MTFILLSGHERHAFVFRAATVFVPLPLFERNHQERDRRRRHTRDPQAWPSETGRTCFSFCLYLGAQSGHTIVIQVIGDGFLFQGREPLDLLELALDITFVLHLDLDLL